MRSVADFQSDGAQPVVLRVVLELGQPKGLEQRRHLHPEPSAQSLLEAIPSANLDISGVGRVGGDVPSVTEPSRRFPLRDLAPLDLVTLRGALEDAPADSML